MFILLAGSTKLLETIWCQAIYSLWKNPVISRGFEKPVITTGFEINDFVFLLLFCVLA